MLLVGRPCRLSAKGASQPPIRHHAILCWVDALLPSTPLELSRRPFGRWAEAGSSHNDKEV